MKAPKRIKALETLASEMVGDGKSPNLFFVTVLGNVTMITRDFQSAVHYWQKLPPLTQSAIEDRRTGVICSVEPDEITGKIVTINSASLE